MHDPTPLTPVKHTHFMTNRPFKAVRTGISVLSGISLLVTAQAAMADSAAQTAIKSHLGGLAITSPGTPDSALLSAIVLAAQQNPTMSAAIAAAALQPVSSEGNKVRFDSVVLSPLITSDVLSALNLTSLPAVQNVTTSVVSALLSNATASQKGAVIATFVGQVAGFAANHLTTTADRTSLANNEINTFQPTNAFVQTGIAQSVIPIVRSTDTNTFANTMSFESGILTGRSIYSKDAITQGLVKGDPADANQIVAWAIGIDNSNANGITAAFLPTFLSDITVANGGPLFSMQHPFSQVSNILVGAMPQLQNLPSIAAVATRFAQDFAKRQLDVGDLNPIADRLGNDILIATAGNQSARDNAIAALAGTLAAGLTQRNDFLGTNSSTPAGQLPASIGFQESQNAELAIIEEADRLAKLDPSAAPLIAAQITQLFNAPGPISMTLAEANQATSIKNAILSRLLSDLKKIDPTESTQIQTASNNSRSSGSPGSTIGFPGYETADENL